MSLFILSLILLTVFLSACAQFALGPGVTSPGMVAAMENGIFLSVPVAYPFVGVSFPVTIGFGAIILGETIALGRFAETVLKMPGCVLVGKSA